MHICDITLSMHEGTFKHRISNVTVPEIVLLREIHGGAEAVSEIEIVDHKNLYAKQEKERLLNKYGVKKAHRDLIERLFPGLTPSFPTSIDQIRVGHENVTSTLAIEQGEAPEKDPTAFDLEKPYVRDDQTAMGDLAHIGADEDEVEKSFPKTADGETDYSALNKLMPKKE